MDKDFMIVYGYFPKCDTLSTRPDKQRSHFDRCDHEHTDVLYDMRVIYCLTHKPKYALKANEVYGVQLRYYKDEHNLDHSDTEFKQEPRRSIYFDSDEREYYKREYELLLNEIHRIENASDYRAEENKLFYNLVHLPLCSYKIYKCENRRYATIKFTLDEENPHATVEVELYSHREREFCFFKTTVSEAFHKIYSWIDQKAEDLIGVQGQSESELKILKARLQSEGLYGTDINDLNSDHDDCNIDHLIRSCGTDNDMCRLVSLGEECAAIICAYVWYDCLSVKLILTSADGYKSCGFVGSISDMIRCIREFATAENKRISEGW